MISDDDLPASNPAGSIAAPQSIGSPDHSQGSGATLADTLQGDPSSSAEVAGRFDEEGSLKTASARTRIKDLKEVTTSDGVVVQCTYKDHPAYDDSNSLYLTFHFIFVIYTASRLSTVAKTLRLAINTFFDFVVIHNNSNPSWVIKAFVDITPIIFESFRKWLDDQSITQGRAYFIRQSVKIVSESYDDIPNLNLPLVSYATGGKTEPLSEDGDEAFQSTCTKVVDRLRAILEFREVVTDAIPYTVEELDEILYPNVMQVLTWYKWHIDNRHPMPHTRLTAMLARCQDHEISALLTSDSPRVGLAKLVTRFGIDIPSDYEGDINYVPNQGVFRLESARVVATFLKYGYPFKLSVSALSDSYSLRTITKPEHCDDAVKKLIYLIMRKRVEAEEGWLTVEGYLRLYVPLAQDAAGLALFIMRKTGWNRESVLAIDPNNFYHHYSKIFKSNIKVLFSEKLRSQSLETEYETGKIVYAVTEPGDRYSADQLMTLVMKLSEPFLTEINDLDKSIHSRATKPIFYYMISWMAWTKAGQFNCLDHTPRFADCVRMFLIENEIWDSGVRLESSQDLTSRLRSTWLQDESLSAPVQWLSSLMGHDSRSTTDIFYDSSERATAVRRERLRGVLELLLARLRQRQFKGLIGHSANLIASERLEIFHIPGFERALWACADSRHPDWHGAPVLKGDERCRSLDNCLFCSRCRLLVDSLPFLMERMEQLEKTNGCDYDDDDSNAPPELKLIGSILAEWGDASDIAKAATYLRKNRPLLPLQISDLIDVIDITLE